MAARSLLVALVALGVVGVVGAGCSSTDAGAAVATAPAVAHDPKPSAPAASPPAPTPEDLVKDPSALLADAFVRRRGDRLRITAVWACNQNSGACPRRYALERSEDEFATVDYLPGGVGRARSSLDLSPPKGAGRSCADVAGATTVCARDAGPRSTSVTWTRGDGVTWEQRDVVHAPRLLPWPVGSLRAGTFAVALGGDGATLFPFEEVAHSPDGGASWSTTGVNRPAGVMAYSEGFVVDTSGRLLALLADWSDDRGGRPSRRVHGLYASNGTDWSTYRPIEPTFRPALVSAPHGWSALASVQASAVPDPVIWVTTWDKRLYVSTDDAHSFREIRLR